MMSRDYTRLLSFVIVAPQQKTLRSEYHSIVLTRGVQLHPLGLAALVEVVVDGAPQHRRGAHRQRRGDRVERAHGETRD